MSASVDLIAWRRHLHTLAEVSGREQVTAAHVQALLESFGPDQMVPGLGGHGLAAVFAGPAPGPTVMFRAELDALPLDETGDLPWSSTHPGCAHKCGHDGHMAILLGLAHRLGRRRPRTGRVITLFQPAEETGSGARAVVDDPAFGPLQPDWIFALHNLPGHPTGQVRVRAGAFTAGSAGLTIGLRGETSHAAYPEQGRSPDQALADLVTGLAVLPIPLEKDGRLALVTVGHARLGDPAFGITPGEAEILATVRSDDPVVLAELKDRAEALARQVAQTHGLAVTLGWSEEFPVTVNHPEAAAAVTAAAAAAGLPCGRPDESPFRWSEDVGHLLNLGRGAMFGLGAGVDHAPLHAGHYDFNDALLEPGLALWDALVDALT